MGVMSPMMGGGDSFKVYQPINVYRVYCKTTDTPSAHRYVNCKRGDYLIATGTTNLQDVTVVSDKGTKSFANWLKSGYQSSDYYSHIVPQFLDAFRIPYNTKNNFKKMLIILDDCTLDISYIKASPTNLEINADFYHIRKLDFEGLDNTQSFQGYGTYTMAASLGQNIPNVPEGYYRVIQLYTPASGYSDMALFEDDTEGKVYLSPNGKSGSNLYSQFIWLEPSASPSDLDVIGLPFGFLEPAYLNGSRFTFLESGRTYKIHNMNTSYTLYLHYKDFKIID